MDSFEANKIFGALLGTVFVLFGGSLVAENIFHSEIPEQPGYAIVAPEPTEGGAAAPEAVPIATLLQTADAEAGATVFRRCQACHSNEDGAPAGVGPHIWNVVNREVAHDPGFSYSAAMTAFSEGGTVVWDYQHLNDFLINPRAHIPGTAMSFAGIQNDGDRADLIAYLRTLSADPAPLPEPPAAGEEAAAEGGEAAAPAEGGEAAAPAEGGEAAAPAAGEAAAPAGGEASPVGATNEGVPASDQPQAPAQSDAAASGAPISEPGTVGTATEGMPPAGVNQANPGDGTNADAPGGAAPAEQPAPAPAPAATPTGTPAPAAAPADGAVAPAPAPAPAPSGTTIVPAPAANAPAAQ